VDFRGVLRGNPNPFRASDAQPWLGAVPVHEFVDGMAIATLGIRSGKAIENGGLRDFKIR
jgi:hypothetical protein